MKANKAKWLVGAGIALVALFQFASGIMDFRNGANSLGCDLRLRRNEVRCAHLGVNSFRIWNREISVPGFVPLGRLDKPEIPKKANEFYVHAYPPWHTAMFYFYGWMSESECISFVSLVWGLCLYFIACECVRIAKARFVHYGVVSALSLALIMFFIVNGYFMLNYGVPVLAAFLLMNKLLEKRYDVAAGLCWAIMMIKPQVGLLFFWPLFWRRHYRTIATAVIACLLATTITSVIVHESVLDLILQILQIGRPYGHGRIVDKAFNLLGVKGLSSAYMPFFFLLAGTVTWALRRSRDFLFCCAPVAFIATIWSYSQVHDHVILLPVFVFLVGAMSKVDNAHKWALWLGGAYCATVVVVDMLVFVTGLDAIFQTRVIDYSQLFMSCAAKTLLAVFVWWLICEGRRQLAREGNHEYHT